MEHPSSALTEFHPVVRSWFTAAFGEPSPPQLLGWPSIAAGRHTLILAPTGSGKTLAAFLWAINHLVEQDLEEAPPSGVRILYISPLKALNNDIERNLAGPLAGITGMAEAAGLSLRQITTAVRTGDTSASRRAAMIRTPPDILITTPESLYLMLTSGKARSIFRTVQYLILDEIHSLCGTKRGVHCSISLERLAALADGAFVRIGLSATQRPLEEIAAFLGGAEWHNGVRVPRHVTIVDAGRKKEMDLRVVCSPRDLSLLPPEGVWPLILDDVDRLIRRHRTTLIFVNNRRLAERIATKLNDRVTGGEQVSNLYAVPAGGSSGAIATDPPPGTPPVQAYHGSMSRQARQQMEADLKAGRLRALVATSSLELGIDIGSIDLVIQIQSPRGVARGLQRVGRSGHMVTTASKGRLFPTHREDLVESVVVAEAMTRHDVEATRIPQNCLDVLAQQIVAMVGVEEWDVDALFDLVRQSHCYRDLPEPLFTGVLRMLAGRSTHEILRELRARISWDRVNNTLRALPGSARLAVLGGGTITDRGYFGVFLQDGKTKIGEVDEEFVYESRAGDTFILGSSVWRMTSIDANRITVAPAPGQPARMPFWRGEGIGRSYELGCMIGAARREIAERLDDETVGEWMEQRFPVEAAAAWNIREYLRAQIRATGVLPSERLLLVEGFRDEIGDPRIVVHCCFGRRVNGLLGLVLARRLSAATGTEPQMLYNDDGVLLRCPDADRLPLALLDGITPAEAEDIVMTDLPSSPLFGGQFRQNAARALLLPKVAPGKRTPLWLQRLRAADLLQVARQVDDFPIVIETVREVLDDVLDYAHFRDLITALAAGTLHLRTVETETPSPFAASLLFDFIAVYMYEWDEPKADRLSRYVSVNRELLSGILDVDTIQALARPEATVAVEDQLQHRAAGYRARTPEELLDILLRVGDLNDEEIALRCEPGTQHLIAALAHNGRAVRRAIAGELRWIAGEEEHTYRSLPSQESIALLLRRHLQTHGPVAGETIAARYDLAPARVEEALQQLAAREPIVRRAFPTGSGEEDRWCYRPNLERIQRTTLGLLRKEISPCSLAEYTRFLCRWQHVSATARVKGREGLESLLEQFQGLPLPAELWEREVFGRRMRPYLAADLQEICVSGTVVWTGAGTGRIRPIFRGEGAVFLGSPTAEVEASFSTPATRVLTYLRDHGASFYRDLRTGARLSLQALNEGIAELFWQGMITNDVLSELLTVRRSFRPSPADRLEPVQMLDPYHNPHRRELMQSVRKALRQVPGWNGRWSLLHVPAVMGESLPMEEQAMVQARQLLRRYGILPREFSRREDLLPWPLLAEALQRMEMRGEIRRGLFVEGLAGMQYALPAAVEELREIRGAGKEADEDLFLHAADPANPYGMGVESGGVRITRGGGNYIAFRNGRPVLLVEGWGVRLSLPPGAMLEEAQPGVEELMALIRLPSAVRPASAIVVETCDGDRATVSRIAPLLHELGFRPDRNQTMKYDGYP